MLPPPTVIVETVLKALLVNTVVPLPALMVSEIAVDPSLVPSTLKVTLAPASLPALVIATI